MIHNFEKIKITSFQANGCTMFTTSRSQLKTGILMLIHMQKFEKGPEFYFKRLSTNKARFTYCGIFNKHNTPFWGTENPREVCKRRFQTKFGFSVWWGPIAYLGKNHVFVPFIFNFNLTVAHLHIFQVCKISSVRILIPNDKK